MLLALILVPAVLLNPIEDPYTFLDLDYDSIAAAASDAYMQEDYDAAIDSYLSFLERNATDVSALYNLACCYGLKGDEELATAFMLRSVRAGFEDLGWITWDPDFESVRNGILFSGAVDSITQAMEEREISLGSILHVPGRTMIPCRIMLPENFDPDVPHNLLIGLHGYGSNPEIFMGIWEAFDEPDFIYAIPQAPYPRFAGSTPGFSWIIRSEDDELASAIGEDSHQYICDVAELLQENYNISDTFLFGFSQGSGITFETGLLNPDLFDGLICFAGWLDTTIVSVNDIETAKELRVFIAHGIEDMVVEYEASAIAFEYLSSFGMDVEFHDFPSGHTVDHETLRQAHAWMRE